MKVWEQLLATAGAESLMARTVCRLRLHGSLHSYHIFQVACAAHASQLRFAKVPLLCRGKQSAWSTMLTSPARQLLCKPPAKAHVELAHTVHGS